MALDASASPRRRGRSTSAPSRSRRAEQTASPQDRNSRSCGSGGVVAASHSARTPRGSPHSAERRRGRSAARASVRPPAQELPRPRVPPRRALPPSVSRMIEYCAASVMFGSSARARVDARRATCAYGRPAAPSRRRSSSGCRAPPRLVRSPGRGAPRVRAWSIACLVRLHVGRERRAAEKQVVRLRVLRHASPAPRSPCRTAQEREESRAEAPRDLSRSADQVVGGRARRVAPEETVALDVHDLQRDAQLSSSFWKCPVSTSATRSSRPAACGSTSPFAYFCVDANGRIASVGM